MRVNYSKEHYCHQCAIKYPLDVFRCPDCHQKIRTKGHTHSSWYRRHEDEIKATSHRRTDRVEKWKVKMRKIRVQRMIAGLRPNIPVPQ